MLVVEEELSSGAEGRDDPCGPCVKEIAGPRVDEVEPRPAELQRQLLDVSLDERDGGRVLAGGGHGLGGRVHAGDERAEPRELRGRLAGAAAEVEDVLAGEVGEALLDGVRQPRRPLLAWSVRLVPDAAVEVGRLHQARSEKPPSTTRVWPRTISASAEAR